MRYLILALFSLVFNPKSIANEELLCQQEIDYFINNASHFMISYKKGAIPKIISKWFSEKKKAPFSIVNPGKPFNKTDNKKPFMKNRALILHGKFENKYVIAFHQGGRGYQSMCYFFSLGDSRNIKQVCFLQLHSTVNDFPSLLEDIKNTDFQPAHVQ